MKNLFNQVVCISWSSALCFIPGPGSDLRSFACPAALAPNLDSPALARCLYLPALVPNFYLQALASNLFLLALAPSCVYRLWPQICIYRPWSTILLTVRGLSFAYTDLVPLIYVCIYGPGIGFVLPVRDLNLHLLYYW